MIVVLVVALRRFVANVTVAKSVSIGQTTLGQELHRSIYRGQTDLRVLATNMLEQVLYRHVPTGREEHFSDELSLPGELQPVAGDVLPQYIDGLSGVCIRLGHGPGAISQDLQGGQQEATAVHFRGREHHDSIQR